MDRGNLRPRGCDAWDEQLEDLAEEIAESARDVAGGSLEEEVTSGLSGHQLTIRWPGRSSSTSLSPAEVRGYGGPGHTDLQPWPARGD